MGRRPDDTSTASGALLTGSSSIHYSRCDARSPSAERLGHERPDWELSLGFRSLIAIARPSASAFLDKDRWAMDWYYPILGGVLRGHAADARVASRRAGRRSWSTTAGVRCVSDQPVGHRGRDVRAGHVARRRSAWSRARARELLRLGAVPPRRRRRLLDRRQLRGRSRSRTSTASYYTVRATHVEQPRPWCSPRTRSAATGPTAGLFRGERLPCGPRPHDELLAAGAEIASQPRRARATAAAGRAARGPPSPPRAGLTRACAATRREPVALTGSKPSATARSSTARRAVARRRPGRGRRRGWPATAEDHVGRHHPR